MEMKELTDVQFDTFVKTQQFNSIYQTSAYAKTMNENGFQTLLLGLLNNNTIVGATIVLIENIDGFKYAYTPRGFVMDLNNPEIIHQFTFYLKKYLKEINVVAIKVNPLIVKNKYNVNKEISYHNNQFAYIMNTFNKLGYRHLGHNNTFKSLKPRFEAVVSLNDNYYSLFKNIKKSFRTKIRNADKLGVIIHKGTKKNIEDLYFHTKRKYPRNQKFLTDIYDNFNVDNKAEIYYSKLDTKKYLTYIQNEYQNQENLCEELDRNILKQSQNLKTISKKIEADNKLSDYATKIKQATKLLQEYPNGVILASVMVIVKDKSVTLFMDGYNKKYQAFNAKHLLVWKLIEKYTKLGYNSFNLGGITDIFDTNEKYKGLNEFKLSFNPEIIEYAEDLELICNQALYFMYSNSKKIKQLIKK